jgi:sporulation protein YlmC with PRC-barrel domain
MTKTMLALATVSTLTLSAALAQAPPPSAPSSTPPAAAETRAPADTGASRGAVNAQKPDEWLVSKQLKGMSVLGSDGTKLGSVDDVLIARDGSIKALVIGVGGFLGIGAKEIGLPFKAFQVVPGTDGKADVLTLSMSKDELTNAEEFKAYEPPRPAAASPPGMGAGGGARQPMAPSSAR